MDKYGVDIWGVIFTYVDWEGEIELYNDLAFVCKVFWKALRRGAANQFRWFVWKDCDFQNNIKAVRVDEMNEFEQVRSDRPDIKDVDVYFYEPRAYVIDCHSVLFRGMEHLYFHAVEGVNSMRVDGPLPEGLISFGMGQCFPFGNKSRTCSIHLPSLLPESLENIVIVGDVSNGLDVNDDIALLPPKLKRFYYVGHHADDTFFEARMPVGLEELTLVSGKYDSMYLRSETLRIFLPKLKHLTILSLKCDVDVFNSEVPEIDLSLYPNLETLTINFPVADIPINNCTVDFGNNFYSITADKEKACFRTTLHFKKDSEPSLKRRK